MFLPDGDGSPMSPLSRPALVAEHSWLGGVEPAEGASGLGGVLGSMAPTGKSLLTSVANALVIGPVTGWPVKAPLDWVVRWAGVVSSARLRPVTGLVPPAPGCRSPEGMPALRRSPMGRVHSLPVVTLI